MAKREKEVRGNQPVQGRREPRVLLPVEAAELLRVSLDQLYHLTSRKKVPFVKIGGALRFDRARLLDFIANGPSVRDDAGEGATAGFRKAAGRGSSRAGGAKRRGGNGRYNFKTPPRTGKRGKK
jgi:excisionase family DNA binding protein